MALSHDAMSLSAVCDCGMSDHSHLLFLFLVEALKGKFDFHF